MDTELSRIMEEAWVRGRIPKEKLGRIERDALDQRESLQSRLDALDPGDIAELKRRGRT